MELMRPEGDVVVRPVPEHRADAELSAVYRDLKATLRVPWVGVVTQAYAFYRPFFLEAWRQFRPTAASAYFHDASEDLRRFAWDSVSAAFPNPAHGARLEETGYAPREIAQIGEVLDLFNAGNPKYLILATAIRATVVEGRRLGLAGAGGRSSDARPSQADAVGSLPVMIEEHHAFGDLRLLYADIKTTLNLPFVNSDYKAMARWPSYLMVAWESLKPRLSDPAYTQARRRLHARAVEVIDGLPSPFVLDAGALGALGMAPHEVEELARTAALFQWLLSGLMLNVSYCQRSLQAAR